MVGTLQKKFVFTFDCFFFCNVTFKKKLYGFKFDTSIKYVHLFFMNDQFKYKKN